MISASGNWYRSYSRSNTLSGGIDTLDAIRPAFTIAGLIVGAVLALTPAYAQQYAFQYFGVEQGLTNLTVKALFQDHTGFIWVVTENGLFRYEGVRFHEFAPEHGLPSSVSASIGEASDGSVLVGNQWGLFRLKGERFQEVKLPKAKRVNGYNGVVRDADRTWIGTEAGLLEARLGDNGELTLRPGPVAPDPRLTEVFSIFVTTDRKLAWGCGTKLCIETGTGIKVYGEEEGLGPERVSSVIRDPKGGWWIQQSRRLRVMHAGSSRFELADPKLPPAGPGSNPEADNDGRLLVPTTEGLAIFEGDSFRLAGRPEGVLPPVYSVLQDREGSVWLGLAGRGVARWLGYGEWESFSAQSGLTGEAVYEILPSQDLVWAGSESGLFKGTRQGNTWKWQQQKALGPIPIHAVKNAQDGRLWLGADGRGVALYDPGRDTVRWFGPAEGLTAHSPYAVIIDRNQTVWTGTETGIYRMPKGTQKFEQVPAAVKSRCWTLLEAPNGDIWAGAGDGLWRFHNGEWKRYTKDDGLQSSSVLALAISGDDLWIGYRLTGSITRMNLAKQPAEIVTYDPPQGRQANLTYFLEFDSKGNLWAGTNLGVLVRSPGATQWEKYDHRDGLIWDDCDLHSFAAEADGHVWIGTSGGLSRFYRRTAVAAVEPPRTVFTSALYGTTVLDPAKVTEAQYSSAPLEVRFTALRFGHDRDVSFRYRTLPLDKQWRETTERMLQIAAIQPGEYTLEVESRETVGANYGATAQIQFRIRPPWWRTWWFLLGCGSAVALLILGAVRQRTRRQEEIRRELERAVAERTRQLAHQYRHDVLTGLPNRLLFGEQLQRELEGARGRKQRVGVLFIDIDRFKRINDTWGHQLGDQFLKEIATRLKTGLRTAEMIGRLGGDEFIVLVPGLRTREEAQQRGQEIVDTLLAPICIEDKNIFATMSVGIATYPDDASDADSLMAAADAAMYAAKAAGKNQAKAFETGMSEAASRPQNIEDKLREALRMGGFRLHFQPQYTISGVLTGFEALLRIQGAERELSPAEFIPIAEESGLIVEMGAWVLYEACRQMKEWNDNGFPDARISVNVSVLQLAHAGFEQFVVSVLDQTGLSPTRLELELTETARVRDPRKSAVVLNRLRARGIAIALDDFGTGYSPMQYLHQLPVDVVKVDQVFVRNLDSSISTMPLVEGMVKLARNLSLRVVAEGVETSTQFRLLKSAGFDVVQGNLLSLPVPPEKALEILRAGHFDAIPG